MKIVRAEACGCANAFAALAQALEAEGYGPVDVLAVRDGMTDGYVVAAKHYAEAIVWRTGLTPAKDCQGVSDLQDRLITVLPTEYVMGAARMLHKAGFRRMPAFSGKEVGVSESDESQSRPPVGGCCEVLFTSGNWEPARIEAYGREHVLFTDIQGHERVEYLDSFRFRPIRTDEERAVEEMMVIAEGPAPGFPTAKTMMQRLYQAGYRKQ